MKLTEEDNSIEFADSYDQLTIDTYTSGATISASHRTSEGEQLTYIALSEDEMKVLCKFLVKQGYNE